MSLINDALKRAREAQDPATTPTGHSPQLRPVDPPQQHHLSSIYFILGMGLLAIVLGLLLVWQLAQRRDLNQRVQARTREAVPEKIAEQEPAHSAAPNAPTPAPGPSVVATATPKTPDPVSAASPETAAAPAPAAPTPEPVAKPAPLKLQGITFHPTRPAAMISGRTLFIGDRTGDWRLVGITQDTATLVNGSQTNILTLPE